MLVRPSCCVSQDHHITVQRHSAISLSLFNSAVSSQQPGWCGPGSRGSATISGVRCQVTGYWCTQITTLARCIHNTAAGINISTAALLPHHITAGHCQTARLSPVTIHQADHDHHQVHGLGSCSVSMLCIAMCVRVSRCIPVSVSRQPVAGTRDVVSRDEEESSRLSHGHQQQHYQCDTVFTLQIGLVTHNVTHDR